MNVTILFSYIVVGDYMSVEITVIVILAVALLYCINTIRDYKKGSYGVAVNSEGEVQDMKKLINTYNSLVKKHAELQRLTMDLLHMYTRMKVQFIMTDRVLSGIQTALIRVFKCLGCLNPSKLPVDPKTMATLHSVGASNWEEVIGTEEGIQEMIKSFNDGDNHRQVEFDDTEKCLHDVLVRANGILPDDLLEMYSNFSKEFTDSLDKED